jgi:hypothetical protein
VLGRLDRVRMPFGLIQEVGSAREAVGDGQNDVAVAVSVSDRVQEKRT